MSVDGFWDAGAIVPLCVGQAGTAFARRTLRNKSTALWWGTSVETTSAFTRLALAEELDQRDLQRAMTRQEGPCITLTSRSITMQVTSKGQVTIPPISVTG